jgi:hypothetical protein
MNLVYSAEDALSFKITEPIIAILVSVQDRTQYQKT